MRTTRSLLTSAEVLLGSVTMAAVLGMGRLFEGDDWLWPLALNVIAAHFVVAVLRRRGASLLISAAVTTLGALVVAAWTTHWSTTAMGIPTGETWSAMSDDISSAWTLYQDVVAPAPVEPGFVLASALAVWCIAYIADWAAFRLWVPFEATLPAGTLFLFTSLLGTERGRGWAVAVFAASVLGLLLLHRMLRQDGTSHWVSERRSLGHRSLLGAGAAIGAVAVVTGMVIGPVVPGADAAGVFDPRALRAGDDSRVTISPLVDIRTRLVDQANVEVFQVRSPRPSYWRLTSLGRFDGRIWSSSGSYGDADGELPRAVEADIATETFEQKFTVSALAAIWLPSAYEPRALAVEDVEVRYDEQSATLIVDNDVPTSDGLVYTVTSASPRLAGPELGAEADVPEDIRDGYLDLPDDFSPRAIDLARRLTEGQETAYDKARAIQDHLRTYQYDLNIGPGHADADIDTFLFETLRGYCEQFAGSFAAMARAVGIPSRVAVGFTQGETDPTDPQLYRVRGEHAHAWPEVYLAGAGWVAFEPTPGRGMPFAESYTGVAPAQAATNQPGSATTSPPTTAGSQIPSAPGDVPQSRNPDAGLDTIGPGSADPDEGAKQSAMQRYLLGPLATALPVLLSIALAYALLVPLGLLLRRVARRRRADSPDRLVAVAWAEAVDDAALAGCQERLSDTYQERAAHVGECIPEVAGHASTLASLLERARYSVDGVGEEAVDEAFEASRAIRSAALNRASRAERVKRWLDLGPIISERRALRSLSQRRITTTARADLEVERGLVS